MNNNVAGQQVQNINIQMRRHMEISGVQDVVSFDELGIILKTICGELTVEGKDIKVGVLDTDRGIVTIDGKIDSIFYGDLDEDKKRGFFGKLLK